MDEGRLAYERLLAGDNEALGVLVALYNTSLTRYLAGILQDPFEAEDLAAETFLVLLLRKPKFAGGSSFKTFLYRIGHHKAVDALRKRRHQAPSLPEEAEDASSPLWEGLLEKERNAQLYRAMGALCPDYREILQLLYFEELTAEEAARVLRKNKKQVFNLHYRAKEALRKELEKEGMQNAAAFD